MDAQAFWNVIGKYNSNTIYIQIVFIFILVFSYVIAINTNLKYLLKIVLGLINIFIGVVFFGYYGTEPIQKYFALPLYILVGCLFIYSGIKNKYDEINRPNIIQSILISLFILYPVVSYLLGNKYPSMVLHIMPCPVITISIAICCGYNKKNIFLLVLLTIWGLTGIKAILFNAYEDIILLVAGIYSLKELIQLIINNKKSIVKCI